jgi:hypothetical protein
MLYATKTEAKEWLANLTANVEKVNAKNARSYWNRGVNEYAIELLETLEYMTDNGEIPTTWQELKKALLNGADNWQWYSEGGCSLCYDKQIAKRLCTPTELKRTDNGRKEPNSREDWIDCQARALYQASNRILHAFNMEV